jgi:hypothetical protein
MCGYTGNNLNHRKSNRSFKENLEAIPGKLSAFPLQQTVVRGTSYIVWKILQYKI